MQLINKLLGRGAPGGAKDESQFHDSDPDTDEAARTAQRRELVQVVLRDSMRRHGIPSAWIECRTLTVASRNAMSSGMHVQLIVRDGADRLLAYVPAFQHSFMDEITRMNPRVGDWLLSLSWQFQNLTATVMPDPGVWSGSSIAALLASTPSGSGALARKDGSAAIPKPVPTPAPTPGLPPPSVQAAASAVDDGEILEDLQALYAIRDASLRGGRQTPSGPSGEADFEDTQPGGDDEAPTSPAPPPRRW